LRKCLRYTTPACFAEM